MATQQLRPTPNFKRATRTAGVMLLACFALPAFANTPKVIPCPDADKADLSIPAADLSAKSVNHEMSLKALDEIAANTFEDSIAPSKFLSPRAEDAIRAAFAGENESLHTSLPKTLLAPIGNPAPLLSNDVENREKRLEGAQQRSAPATTGLSNGREMNTVLPGVSDDDFSRYKKQMFRRDI